MAEVQLDAAASALGVSTKSVRRWIKQGAPNRRDERGWILVDVEQLRAWRRARNEALRLARETARAAPAPEAPPSAPAAIDEAEHDELGAPPELDPQREEPAVRADPDQEHDRLLAAIDTLPQVQDGSAQQARGCRSHHAEEPGDLDPLEAERRRVLADFARPASTLSRGALGAIVATTELLKRAAALTVVRLPEAVGESPELGERGGTTIGIGAAQLKEIMRNGGLHAWLDQNCGSGRYGLAWSGAAGERLHTEVLLVVSADRHAALVEAGRERAKALRRRHRDEEVATQRQAHEAWFRERQEEARKAQRVAEAARAREFVSWWSVAVLREAKARGGSPDQDRLLACATTYLRDFAQELMVLHPLEVAARLEALLPVGQRVLIRRGRSSWEAVRDLFGLPPSAWSSDWDRRRRRWPGQRRATAGRAVDSRGHSSYPGPGLGYPRS